MTSIEGTTLTAWIWCSAASLTKPAGSNQRCSTEMPGSGLWKPPTWTSSPNECDIGSADSPRVVPGT
jgi:hypothetical protein